MIKYFTTVLGILLINTNFSWAIELTEEGELLRRLVSYHNAAYGADDLFKEQIKPANIKDWLNVILDIKKFVEKNSKKDNDLLAPLATLENINTDLINAIKVAYAVRTAKTELLVQIKKFAALSERAKNAQFRLEKAKFYVDKQEKEKARDLLLALGKFIEATADKAEEDAIKYMRKASE